MAGIKWKRKEINVLEIDYPKYGIEYCSIKLSRSHNSIKIKASRLNINKYFEWNDEKVSFLIKNYPNSSRRECAEQLGISLYQLKEKAQQIGLKRKFLSKKERENLPKNKMIKNLRTRLYLAIKKNKKINHSVVLFGCSILKLKEHLESKFKEGMSWDNYGFYGWHIDHIRPCVSFDLSNPEEQKLCFHYTNLQPLWAEENFKKSDTYIT